MAGGRKRCGGKTKAGKPCKSTGVLENGFCMAHQPEEVRRSRGFGEAGRHGGKPGRPRRPRATEILRERVEANIDAVLKPLFDGLEAEKAIAVSGGAKEPGYIEFVDDMPTRLRAAADILDRVYGKPKQTTELTGSGADGALRIELPRTPERAASVASILAGAGALPGATPHSGRRRPSPATPAQRPAPAKPSNGHRGNGTP